MIGIDLKTDDTACASAFRNNIGPPQSTRTQVLFMDFVLYDWFKDGPEYHSLSLSACGKPGPAGNWHRQDLTLKL